ncbi:MAG: hypothetical protein WC900_00120 [Oscillospiraceae bacterium]|jgi:hypothetical protein
MANILTDEFIQLIKQMNEQAYENEAKLAVEENGAKIADLQGYLAGVRRYKAILQENDYFLDVKYLGTTERGVFYFDEENNCNLDNNEIRIALSGIEQVTDSAKWQDVKTSCEKAINAMKDMLFYQSEKGRDLHFCKGWYSAMKQIDKYIEALVSQLEFLEKEKSESLPFEE